MVHAMLSNAASAALLAALALALGCVTRSPAVRHAAWVLVLLKLVTPPLVPLPLRVLPAAWAAHPDEPAGEFVARFAPAADGAAPPPAEPAAAGPGAWERVRSASATEWAGAGWAAGAAGWFGWQGRRIVRFRRRVRGAAAAPPEVVEAATALARALGVASPPGVRVATGIGSPMLWGWGRRAVVLFPRDLLARLAPEARDALLAHELAHFLRRDHWVRVLEFVACGLFWWHPVVWLARARIEEAEEECCDAWVVGGLATSPRLYAGALLATVDFEAELRRPQLPPGACAASRGARLLRRRLAGIAHAAAPRRLRGGAALRVVAAAVLLTRPALRAASPECAEPADLPVAAAGEVPRGPGARPAPQPKAPAEPRAWATAAAPGGLSVAARDREVVLRLPDGTTRVLGPGRPLAAAFAPGGRRLATAGPGPLVRTWTDRGEPVAGASTPAAARALAYSPDGARLLVLDAAGGVSVLDPQTLALVSNWAVEGPANSLAFAPDGKTVAVAFGSWLAETGWVECWSVAERKKVAGFPAPAPVGATRFSPDGGKLVVGAWNGRVAWRSLPSGNVLAERQLPKALVASAAFSPDAGTLPLEPPPEPEPEPGPAIELVPGRAPPPDR